MSIFFAINIRIDQGMTQEINFSVRAKLMF